MMIGSISIKHTVDKSILKIIYSLLDFYRKKNKIITLKRIIIASDQNL